MSELLTYGSVGGGGSNPAPYPAPNAGIASQLTIEHHWPGVGEPGRSMKTLPAIVAIAILVGCGPPPVPKATHEQQIRRTIAAVGVTNIISESRTLFARLSHETNASAYQMLMPGDRHFAGFSSLTKLGHPFDYASNQPDRISIRVYNNHHDVYSIFLLNPDMPEPPGFERIAGNVGFIEPDGAANASQPNRSQTNSTPSAVGSRR